MQAQITLNELEKEKELIEDNIHIINDVQENTIIDSHVLQIDGISHKDSTQFSKYASIYTHQGTLRCHEANITLLDDGEVHATDVKIDTAIGGSIYAQSVTIKHLTGDVKIYASKSIDIEFISGKNNTLTINYQNVPILMSKIDLINDDLDELSTSLFQAKKDNSSLEEEIQREIERLKKELQDIEQSTKTANIKILKPVKTSNTISFKIDALNEISFETTKEQYTPFHLEFNNNTVTLKPTTQTITLNS